ncbi:MAG: ABC transporter substrate-binding protein [Chloroflexota bacterium]
MIKTRTLLTLISILVFIFISGCDLSTLSTANNVSPSPTALSEIEENQEEISEIVEEEAVEISILGPIRGPEQENLQIVFNKFEEQYPSIKVNYTGSSGFETMIQAQVESGEVPDIAIFPQPGAVSALARNGKIVPLWDEVNQIVAQEFSESWVELASVDGVPYGLFHRVNLKGLVWYDKPAFEAAGFQEPANWGELNQLIRKMQATGIAPFCEGIESGAATGWKGTDWIEIIMLRTQPAFVYDAWTNHELNFSSPEVRNAFQILESFWFNEAIFRGGEEAISLTNFRDPASDIFGDNKDCWMHMQGNFIVGFFPEEISADLDNQVGVFSLPTIDNSLPSAQEVGGDMWVVFEGRDSMEVRQLIEFLATPEGANPWIAQGGAIFPHQNQDVSLYPTQIDADLAQLIIMADIVRFDASDNMDPDVNAAFWKGISDWTSGSKTVNEVLLEIDRTLP